MLILSLGEHTIYTMLLWLFYIKLSIDFKVLQYGSISQIT